MTECAPGDAVPSAGSSALRNLSPRVGDLVYVSTLNFAPNPDLFYVVSASVSLLFMAVESYVMMHAAIFDKLVNRSHHNYILSQNCWIIVTIDH